MKKLFSVILTALMLFSLAIPAFANDYTLDTGTKTDILKNATGYFESLATTGLLSDLCGEDKDILTDGIFARSVAHTKPMVYINLPVCENQDAVNESYQNGPTFKRTLTDGTEKAYYYTIEYTGLHDSCAGFAAYFTNEADFDVKGSVPNYQIDASFDILVSCDGGQTYSVAWSSTPYEVSFTSKTNGQVITCAGMLEDDGFGDMKEDVGVDENGLRFAYKYVVANFDKEYSGVTNIVYACSNYRRNGNQDKPMYYCARMSEFDVYRDFPCEVTTVAETTKETEPEATTAAAETKAQADETTAAGNDSVDVAVTSAEPAVSGGTETKASEEKSGCGSAAASAVCVLIAAAGTALCFKRKKED